MHPLMLQQVIASCRNRITQGDCPTTPTFPVEQLEEAVVELAAQQPPLSLLTCIWDGCDLDPIYCEGHAKEAFAPAAQQPETPTLADDADSIRALKKALRKHAICEGYCHECERIIYNPGDDEPEPHAPGCLATPDSAASPTGGER